MTSNPNVTERFVAGDAVDVSEIVARLDELETVFEDRGFEYIAINGWLIPSLDSSQEARELMFLRAIHEHLGELTDGTVLLAARSDSDAGEFVCHLSGRYGPDGYLYSVTTCDAGPEGIPAPSARP